MRSFVGCMGFVLAVAACGSDPMFDDTPDATSDDAGEARRDARPLDLGFFDDASQPDGSGGMEEAGVLDGTVPLDATAPDAGFGDFGVVSGSAEGQPCTPDPSGSDLPGDCREPGAACHVWQASPRLATCMTPCQSDADCPASSGNPICRNVGLRADPVQICVAEESDEDGRCYGSSRNGTAMIGCRPDLDCVRGVSDLSADEGVCARVCDPLGGPPASSCNSADYPYCNPDLVTTLEGTFSVCSVRQIRAGALCSLESLTWACDHDLATSGKLECISLPSMTTVSGEGICIETCDPDAPSCLHQGASAQASLCVAPDVGQSCSTDAECRAQGFDRCHPGSAVCTLDRGFCEDGCSNYPDDCLGTGSEGLGMTCFGPFTRDTDGNGAATPMSFCVDVADPPYTETLLLWDGATGLTNGVTGEPCTQAGTARHCPDHTTCFRSGSDGRCLRGCEIPTSSTCQGLSATAVCVAIAPTIGLCAEPP